MTYVGVELLGQLKRNISKESFASHVFLCCPILCLLIHVSQGTLHRLQTWSIFNMYWGACPWIFAEQNLLVQNAFCVSVVPLTSSQCRLKKLSTTKNRFCFCRGFAFTRNLYEVVQASLVFGKISSDEIYLDISMFPVWMRCLTKTCALTRSLS